MLKKIWNGKFSGLFGLLLISIQIVQSKISNYLFYFFHKRNFNSVGEGTLLYRNLIYRFPRRITIGKNCIINRYVTMDSESHDSFLIIGNNVSIACHVKVDFTGNITIADNVTISESVSIFTHDHGMDPRSTPIKKSLIIEKNVWIGANSLILQNVNVIGENSIIAAGSIVTKDVSPNEIVGGNPAKFLKYIPILY